MPAPPRRNRFSPYYGSSSGGNHFSSSIPPGYKFAGFHGRAGNLVDQIGLIIYTP